MSELVKIWLTTLFQSELDDIEGTIDNNRIWKKGAATSEEAEDFSRTIEYLEEYKEVIENFMTQVKEG